VPIAGRAGDTAVDAGGARQQLQDGGADIGKVSRRTLTLTLQHQSPPVPVCSNVPWSPACGYRGRVRIQPGFVGP